jgi:hypothetical protein
VTAKIIARSMNPSSATTLVRQLLETEFASGFPFVRRFPSVEVWKSLVHLESLSPQDRDVLFGMLAERGSGWLAFFDRQGKVEPTDFQRYYERQRELVAHPVYQRYVAERTQPWPWKYADPSFLRQMLDAYRSSGSPAPDFSPVPLSVVEAAEPPKTATAAEIRKAIKVTFAERFRARPTNMGSGIWNYPGEHQGRPFTLTIDYGGNFFKLRYGVSVGQFPAKQHLTGVSWDEMLGLGIGHWSFVCRHNLTQTVELLAEIIEKMVMLPEQARERGALESRSAQEPDS